MKSILAAASAILLITHLTTQVQGTAQCLYCRRSDISATFMVSYSYCESSDTCLLDKWLYIDRPCTTYWKRGNSMYLDDCAPRKTTCHPFTSTPVAAGNWFNFTETLGANEFCQIDIDTTDFIGRAVIDDAITVGAHYLFLDDPSLPYNYTMKIGQQLDIEQGKKVTIWAYNGDTSGSITFTLAFRNAIYLVGKALVGALLASVAVLSI